MTKRLTEQDYVSAASILGVELAAVKTIFGYRFFTNTPHREVV